MMKGREWAIRILLACVFVAACDDPAPPREARMFRDNFDSLASAWTVSGSGVSVDGGELRLTTVVGAVPEAKYELPTPPYGPGWDFNVSVGFGGGTACSVIEISTGHSRRHTWALELDAADDYWDLQVGDGDGWERVGYSSREGHVASPANVRLRVKDDSVRVWLNSLEVVETLVRGAAPNAVDIKLGASRCQIRPGVVVYDWVEIRELGAAEPVAPLLGAGVDVPSHGAPASSPSRSRPYSRSGRVSSTSRIGSSRLAMRSGTVLIV